MRARIPFLFTILLAFLAPAAVAQNRQFSWSDMFCDYVGDYDPAKVTEAQLRDTRVLIDFGMGLPLQTDQNVWAPSEIASLDVNALDKEYVEVKKQLSDLEPVDNEYFRSLKMRHLRTLEASYALKRSTLLAHSDPSVLAKVERQEACFVKWGKPVIAGGETLLDAWKALLAEQKERNGRPDLLQARFDERFSSPERDKWALLEVLSFGWWNCVNKSIPYVENDGSIEEEFRKLFVKVEDKDYEEPE